MRSSEVYNMYKERIGSDFTYLSSKDFEYLINENDIKAVKERLTYCMSNTKKMDERDLNEKVINSCNIVENNYIEIMINEKNLLKLKKDVRSIICGNTKDIKAGEYIENLSNPSSKNKFVIGEFEYLLCAEQTDFQSIKDAKDIKELKKSMSSMIDELENAKSGYKKEKIECMSEYYAKKLEFLNVLYMMDDIYDIKNEYKQRGLTSKEELKKLAEQYVDKRQESIERYETDVSNDDINDLEIPINRNYDFDFKEVYNQMITKVIGRNEQIRKILNMIKENDSSKDKRSSLIIAGGTGTGKTETFRQLKEAIKNIRPVITVDTNELTETGYHGGSIGNNILAKLLESALEVNKQKGFNYKLTSTENIETAEHGIVFLDEIDKRVERGGDKGNVNKGAVINELLKLFDLGTSYDININNQRITFNTSNLNIAVGGAFQEYFDDIEKKNGTFGIGINSTERKIELKGINIDPKILIRYGLSSQFVARCSVALLYLPHTKETLLQLEETEDTSCLYSKIKMYENKGINVVWEDGYLEEIAANAYAMKIGGRALQSVVEKALGNLNIEIEQRKNEYNFKTIYLTKESIKDSGKIIILDKNNKIMRLQDLYSMTALEDEKSLEKKKILRKKDAYLEIKKVLGL